MRFRPHGRCPVSATAHWAASASPGTRARGKTQDRDRADQAVAFEDAKLTRLWRGLGVRLHREGDLIHRLTVDTRLNDIAAAWRPRYWSQRQRKRHVERASWLG